MPAQSAPYDFNRNQTPKKKLFRFCCSLMVHNNNAGPLSTKKLNYNTKNVVAEFGLHPLFQVATERTGPPLPPGLVPPPPRSSGGQSEKYETIFSPFPRRYREGWRWVGGGGGRLMIFDCFRYGGVHGTYWGGYGYCFRCGSPTHWANNCPNR